MKISIDSLSRLTGISKYTLRNWEKRYSILRPKRQKNGFRAYSAQDVVFLKKLSALVESGHSISDLSYALKNNQPLPELSDEFGPEDDQSLAKIAVRLKKHLIEYNVEQAEMLCSKASKRYSAENLLERVFRPLLVQMGEDWAEGQITVAHEHFASAFLRARIMEYITVYDPNPNKRMGRVLCATLSGERHEGGILLLAAQLKMKGLSIVYLGADVPVDDLADVVERARPSAICLSYAQASLFEDHLPIIKAFSIPVFVGGYGVREFNPKDALPENIRASDARANEAAEFIVKLLKKSKVPYKERSAT